MAARLQSLGATGARFLSDQAPLLALLGIVIGLTIATPSFLSARNLVVVGTEASVLLVAAVGQTFVILLGSIDLSTEGVMATSSMVVALLVANDRTHLSLGAAGILLTVAVGGGFGLVNGTVHAVGRIPSFMVTLGTWYVGIGIATVLFAGQTPVIQSALTTGLAQTRVLGVPPLVFIAAVSAAIGIVLLNWTRFGRYILTIGGNEQLAQLAGVPVTRYKILAFSLAGAMNALAGILATAEIGNGSVTVGTGMVFATIASVVVGGTPLTGGRGGIWNTVIGVLILTSIADGMILAGTGPQIQQSVQGAVVVIAVAASSWALRKRLRVVK